MKDDKSPKFSSQFSFKTSRFHEPYLIINCTEIFGTKYGQHKSCAIGDGHGTDFHCKRMSLLYKLLERNVEGNFKNSSEPLNRPMDVEERKLRSRIRKKCKIYIYELALA